VSAVLSTRPPPTAPSTPMYVCMGGDWYTFPSHFFLPDHVRLAFVKDIFHGQLPQLYHPKNGTMYDPSSRRFNDRNEEDGDRYIVDVDASCDYIVSLQHSHSIDNGSLKSYLRSSACPFEKLSSESIINPLTSPTLTRAFFIPFLSLKRHNYSKYTLFRNKRK
jgi:alpha-1,2-mannosyltransferase